MSQDKSTVVIFAPCGITWQGLALSHTFELLTISCMSQNGLFQTPGFYSKVSICKMVADKSSQLLITSVKLSAGITKYFIVKDREVSKTVKSALFSYPKDWI